MPGDDLPDLMRFYEQGRKDGDFEAGIRLALQAMLANPRFVFRLEQAPRDAARRADLPHHRPRSGVAAVVLPLGHGARRGAGAGGDQRGARERRPASTSRCAACSRIRASEALATRFGAQWLRLQDIKKNRPDPLLFPQWDDTLADAFRRETELFFDSIVREDRNVLDLLTADYTFVNERIAKHYGIPNVMGNQFRRVRCPTEPRRGILGHGSVLQLDLGRRSHVAGAARQVGDGSAARDAAAAAAAERARLSKRPKA